MIFRPKEKRKPPSESKRDEKLEPTSQLSLLVPFFAISIQPTAAKRHHILSREAATRNSCGRQPTDGASPQMCYLRLCSKRMPPITIATPMKPSSRYQRHRLLGRSSSGSGMPKAVNVKSSGL